VTLAFEMSLNMAADQKALVACPGI